MILCQPADHFFVRRREYQRPVLEMKQDVTECLDPSCFLPEFDRAERGEMEFLPADVVHLFPYDFRDFFHHTVAEGKIHINTGSEGTYQPGADHQLVAGYHCVSRDFLYGRDETGTDTHTGLCHVG